MTTLHLMHGFIGTGKTSFAKKLELEVSAIRFTHDELLQDFYTEKDDDNFSNNSERIKLFVWKTVKKLLQLNQDVIIDFGAWTRKERDFAINFAKELDCECKIYYIYCPTEIALQRTLKRTDNIDDSSMLIDEDTFNILLKQFEPVSDDEKYILIDNE